MSDNTQPMAPIGVQLRKLRKQKGWTLAELARRAGTSAPTLHRYEGGWNRFELATLRRLARALDARVEIRLVSSATSAEEHDPLPPAELVRLLSPLFWDKKLERTDLVDYPLWVLRRTLMFGNLSQARAVRRFFGDPAVREAVEHRSVDAKTRNYWRVVLGVQPPNETRKVG